MNPDMERIQKQLDAVTELSRENNRMLTSLWKHHRVVRVFRIIYLVLIIAAALGIYYYLEPYLEMISRLYTGNSETLLQVMKAFQ